ncbi:hypothetical protein [Sphingomonas sp.]|uniref:hypothetical protein n=1 Tax=Sphingomonas sp. TaxID=28214 RepID=UPI002D05B505|nr:hypothetical protein [Sphingomonas sp.]HWK36350.1 hypothetical protein [Sphingomonas sp.]
MVLIVLALPILAWWAADTLRDLLLFLTPEETMKRRLHRRYGDGPAYHAAVARIDARKPVSIILGSVSGLIGLLATAWLIFG